MDTRKIRLTALLTQEEFAKKIGVSASTVAKWERGVFKPSLKQQRKIIEFCKKSEIAYIKENGLRN